MVRVAYTAEVWARLRQQPYPNAVPLQGLPRAQELAAQLGEAFQQPGTSSAGGSECCPLGEGQDQVDFTPVTGLDQVLKGRCWGAILTAAVLAG
jgi:hypothetical protein